MNIKSIINKNTYEVLLVVIIVMLVLVPMDIPHFIATIFDSMVGRVSLLFACLYVLLKKPLVGVLMFMAVFLLIHKSEVRTGSYGLRHFIPSEAKRAREMEALNKVNKFDMTLEEEQVVKMVKPEFDQEDMSKVEETNFKPMQSNINSAVKL